MKKSCSLPVVLAVLALLSFGALSAFCQEPEAARRGFMFELGGGPAAINYGAAEAVFSHATSLGLERLELGLNAGLGWALTKDLYALLLVDAVATRIYDSSGDFVQVNSYLYGGGLRVYPMHTGLVLGLDAGASAMVVLSSSASTATSPMGWGVAASAAYDFNSGATGFSLVLGAKLACFAVVSDRVTAVSAFLDLLWK